MQFICSILNLFIGMASTDWVFCTIRTELLRCILPKFSLDTAYKRRGQSIPRDDGCRRHKPTIILFNHLCSFFDWERISDLPTWKNVELLTQMCSAHSWQEKGPSHVFFATQSLTMHYPLCKAKAFSTPEKPPLALAWIRSGGCFILPFISGNLHCSQDSSFSHVFL